MKESSNQEINSKFKLVIAAAKRSKQIASEAKTKGLSPNELALVRSKFVKPIPLALEEIKAGKVHCVQNKRSPADKITKTEVLYSKEDDISLESLGSEKIEISENEC